VENDHYAQSSIGVALSADLGAKADALLLIQDELVYIIECIMEDFTGEAKGSFRNLETVIAAAVVLPALVRSEIHEQAAQLLQRLRTSAYDPQVRTDIVTLRRRIFNTIAALRGRDKTYHYAVPFVMTQVCT
jgi:hypothetical protein